MKIYCNQAYHPEILYTSNGHEWLVLDTELKSGLGIKDDKAAEDDVRESALEQFNAVYDGVDVVLVDKLRRHGFKPSLTFKALVNVIDETLMDDGVESICYYLEFPDGTTDAYSCFGF